MTKTNNFVFKALYIIAWLIFVGLSIEAGGLLVSIFLSSISARLCGEPLPETGPARDADAKQVILFRGSTR